MRPPPMQWQNHKRRIKADFAVETRLKEGLDSEVMHGLMTKGEAEKTAVKYC